MTFQPIDLNIKRFSPTSNSNKTKAKIEKKFKSMMDLEFDNFSPPSDGRLFYGLSSALAISPKTLKNIEKTRTIDWNALEKTLLRICCNIEKTGKSSCQVQLVFDTGITGVLQINAIQDKSGIHIHLIGNTNLSEKISKKISYLNKCLSKSTRKSTRVTCNFSEENIESGGLEAGKENEDLEMKKTLPSLPSGYKHA